MKCSFWKKYFLDNLFMSMGFDLDEEEFFIFIIYSLHHYFFVYESILLIVEITLCGQTSLLRN